MITSIHSPQSIGGYHLLPLASLTPTEEIDEFRVLEVRKKILDDGYWTTPILVEKDALLVMDGHHRLAVAMALGLRFIPCILASYDEVDVDAWRTGEMITPAIIFEAATKKQKFPFKTTRHIYRGVFPPCSIPLSDLYSQTKGLHRLA